MIGVRIALFVLLLNVVIGSKLPSNLKRCKRKDYDCLKQAIIDAVPKFAKGIKSLGVLGIDPLAIPKMVIPSGEGVVKMTQTYTDCELIGLSTAKIDELIYDGDGGQTIWKLSIPKLIFKGHYTMTGTFLVLPVNGKGPMEVIIEKGNAEFVGTLNKVTKNKEPHFKMSNTSLILDAEHVTYNFENLFDGNKEFSAEINKVLNENWKDVWNDVRTNYGEGFKKFTDSLAQKFYDAVPLNEIFLD